MAQTAHLHNFILGEEQKRRDRLYGSQAKLFQLYTLLGVGASVYIATVVRMWWYTAPLQTVVIDGVAVDVVPDDTLAHSIARFSGICCVLAAFGIFVVRSEVLRKLFPTTSDVTGSGPKRVAGAATAAAQERSRTEPSFALKPTTSSTSSLTAGSLWWNPSSGNHPDRIGASSIGWNGVHDAATGVRTLEDLEGLFRGHRGDATTDVNAMPPGPHATASRFPTGGGYMQVGRDLLGGVGAGGAPSSLGGIAVRYDPTSAASGPNGNVRQAATAESELAALGVMHVDRSVAKLKQWVSGLCKAIVEDMEKCDAWFWEKRIRGFDCANPLSDWHEVAATSATAARPPVAGGFGGGFSGGAMQPPQPPQPEKIRKTDALMNEKRKLQLQNASSLEIYDCIHRIDLRLSLESVLDISSTFPSIGSAELPPQVAARGRHGTMQRIRSLASQRSLSSLSCSSDSPHVPADPYLIAHILRTRVPCLANYIQLPYPTSGGGARAGGGARDLRIYVGGNGDPYFYVRHRTGMHEKHMNTTEGTDSLFEALLLFFAVVQQVYHGAYGNVEGIVDLKQLNLDSIL